MLRTTPVGLLARTGSLTTRTRAESRGTTTGRSAVTNRGAMSQVALR
jgi:hypothetical protein